MSLINTGKVAKAFKNRQKNNNWTLVSFLGLGAIAGAVISRKAKVNKPIKKFINIAQNKGSQNQLNLATTEFSKEFAPMIKEIQKQ
jgi:hypothetical protein